MKKLAIVLAVFIAVAIKTNAQIPNNGFEDWTSFASYDDPVGWATMNSLCTGPSFYSVTKSSDHYPSGIGSFSVKIECNTSLTGATGGWGVIATKGFDFPFKPAFPINNHPLRLCGYAKYLPENGDEAVIRVVLFNNGTEVANNSTTITGSGSAWQSFIVEFDSYLDADSATIVIMAWKPLGQNDPPKGNSVIYIDNLSFDNHITSANEITFSHNNYLIYPNPASGVITLEIYNANSVGQTLNIYNTQGTLVKSETLLNNQQQVSIMDLSNAVYIAEIRHGESTVKQKLIIQR